MYTLALCLVALVTLTINPFYASLAEWWLHGKVMHQPLLGFQYPYVAHDKTHHGVFRADHTYLLQDKEKAYLIKMAWWNWMALVPLGTLPIALLTTPLLWTEWWAVMPVVCASTAVGIFGYYCAYEYLHWCMHDPKNRWIEQTRMFRYLNEHHLRHHANPKKNLNVVFPFADWLMDTLMIRRRTSVAA